MSSSYDQAVEIIDKLAAAGVRATTDPGAANPPVVLLLPPERTYNLGCGYTARWLFVALAPGAQGADRSSWQVLDRLADAVAEVVDVIDVQLVTYTLSGTAYPAFLLNAEEAIS
jgi:hypothetical protein